MPSCKRLIFSVLVCLTVVSPARTGFAQLDSRTPRRISAPERSTAFDPLLDQDIEKSLGGFRNEPLPAFHASTLEELQHISQENYGAEDLLLSLDLFRSLSAYTRNRAFQAQALSDNVIGESVPAGRANVDASLLGALEFFGHSPLRRIDVIQGIGRLTHIIDVNAASAAIQPEIRFWRAEGYRELGEYAQAEQEYQRALSKSSDPRLTALTNFRFGELLEHDEQFKAADSAFLSTTRVPQSPLILLAMLRRAAVLRSEKDYTGVLDQLGIADSFFSHSNRTVRTSARDVQYVSPLIEELMLQSTEGDRILASAPNGGLPRVFAPASAQLVSPYYLSEIALLRGSALSELGRYEESTNVLLAGESGIQQANDTTGSPFLGEQARFVSSALKFERGWSLFQRTKYEDAAAAFLQLASEDTTRRHLLARNTQSSLRDAGAYYDPFLNDSAAQVPYATLDRTVLSRNTIDTSFFFYNDFSERARFYAGVALARAGKHKEAADIFLRLAEDKSVLYSDKANYQLGLLSFIGKGYQAQSLLEPLSYERSTSGAYASFLMGELNYRKQIYEKADLYFENALIQLPKSDTAIRATAYLERGLSLVPLANWPEVSNALSSYLELDRNQIPGKTDEALYWLGKAFMHTGQPDSAQRAFSELLSGFPKSSHLIDAQYNYAWTLFEQNNFAGAESQFEKVVAMDSISRFSYDVLARAGDSYYGIAEYLKANKLYNQAVDRPAFNDLRTTRALLQLGLTRMKLDSARSALKVFQYLTAKYPNSDNVTDAYFDEMIAAYEIKQPSDAESLVEKIVQQFPQSAVAPRALYVAAEERVRSNDYPGAVPYYMLTVQDYPRSKEAGPALFHMQEALLSMKQPDRALAAADTFIARNPGSTLGPDILLRSGELELRIGQGPHAMATFQEFISKYPEHPQIPFAQVDLARAELLAGDTAKAIGQLSLVTNQYDSTAAAPFAYLERARVERSSHALPAAIADYQRASQERFVASDATAQALMELAQVYVDEKQSDSAIAVFDNIASRYPSSSAYAARALIREGSLLTEAAHYDEARHVLLRVVSSHSKDSFGGAATVRIGESYLAESNWKDASASFLTAKRDFALTEESEVKRLIGISEADAHLGNKKEAVRSLHTLLGMKAVPPISRQQADSMLIRLTPPKKAKRATKKGATK